MMRITENKGFQMTFDNGLTISCQMGCSNYCSNRDFQKIFLFQSEMKQSVTECKDCEVAIWNEKDEWITGKIFSEMGLDSSEDAVAGYVDTMTVAKIIAYVSTK